MRDPRRLVAVLILGMLISVGGATVLRNAEAGDVVVDNPSLAVPKVTSTTVAPVTTAAPVAAAASRPVRPPADPYAMEKPTVIGEIEIPKIGLKHTLYEGITLRTIDRGPSHWPGSAMPGQRGNAVFAGHRVTHSKPFRNIDQLEPGDEIVFNVGGVRWVYKVTGSKIVGPKALDIVNPTPTPTATLFACHPPGSAAFRLVVLADLVENAQASAPAVVQEQPPPSQPPPEQPPPSQPPPEPPPEV